MSSPLLAIRAQIVALSAQCDALLATVDAMMSSPRPSAPEATPRAVEVPGSIPRPLTTFDGPVRMPVSAPLPDNNGDLKPASSTSGVS